MRVFLRTFGCRANQYDTERVRAMVLAGGGEIVDAPSGADIAVFNSCTVTAAAEADLRQAVRRASRGNRQLRTIVMGCAAAVDGGVLRELPSVSDVIGGADLTRIASALELPAEVVRRVPNEQTGTRALLRIQDGCDEHCTFCATRLARGSSRSRPADEIIAEASALAERHAEIVLTGIHIGGYGADIGDSLGSLVERLIDEVAAVRFRLTSIEATEVDERLRERFTDPTRLAPHLHAPLQSGSDPVLRRMGRHWYTAASYANAVERIVDGRDVFALGADVLVGFPGETEADHADTIRLIESLPFTYLHVFPYSVRPDTPATRLGPVVPSATIDRRVAELRAIAEQKCVRYGSARLGTHADVVALGGAGERDGLTEDYLTVGLPDPPPPRGTRFIARLAGDPARLIARQPRPIFV
jgi:threonylcarbamoyladenosine tRNA methylthiotransferase MtaB